MAGGVSGAASGGILGLVLVLLAQQFGYLDFTSIINSVILLVLVVVVFAVVFGILGRAMKGRAIRRAEAEAPASPATETIPPTPAESVPADPVPVEPDTPPPS
jgi:hypothetical protein